MNDRPQKPKTRRGKCHYRAAFDEGVSVCRLMLRLCKDVEDWVSAFERISREEAQNESNDRQ